jgi:hypothetical protein
MRNTKTGKREREKKIDGEETGHENTTTQRKDQKHDAHDLLGVVRALVFVVVECNSQRAKLEREEGGFGCANRKSATSLVFLIIVQNNK